MTYLEVKEKFGPENGAFRNKVHIAALIKAHAILAEATPTAERKSWALAAIDSKSHSDQSIERVIRWLAAEFNGVSAATIDAATDATIQSKVDLAAEAIIVATTA